MLLSRFSQRMSSKQWDPGCTPTCLLSSVNLVLPIALEMAHDEYNQAVITEWMRLRVFEYTYNRCEDHGNMQNTTNLSGAFSSTAKSLQIMC